MKQPWLKAAFTASILFAPGAARADSLDDYLDAWSARAHAALESQPHWIPPINTVTPRLTQVVRYDQYFESTNTGAAINAFDSGKGVEIIPWETTSLTFNMPPYDEREKKSGATGWGDWPFLLVKQRLASAPEDTGDYILTAYLSFQAPVGSAAFTSHAWVVSPGIGFGKGWGDFNIEGSVVAAIPTARSQIIGTAITTNLTAQYHIARFFWPEVELNNTVWSGGSRAGLDQLFVTTGVIFGNLPLTENYAVGIGGGYQFALLPKVITIPALTPMYDHNWVLTLRLGY